MKKNIIAKSIFGNIRIINMMMYVTINCFVHTITILYYLFYYSSRAKTLNKFTNIVNPNYQLWHSRQLLVHPQLPKHHQLLNQQQRLSLLLEIKIKTILFCIPKVKFRMMQESQIMATYSLLRQ